jgi:hypothetical protein
VPHFLLHLSPQVYRWEKRDYNSLQQVLKVPRIPMPPEYQDGWTLEFDAPLNRKRHDLVVLMLAQVCGLGSRCSLAGFAPPSTHAQSNT